MVITGFSSLSWKYGRLNIIVCILLVYAARGSYLTISAAPNGNIE